MRVSVSEGWQKCKPYLIALTIYSSSRLVVLWAMYIAVRFVVPAPRMQLSDLVASTSWYRYLLRWDSIWYATILKEGYNYNGNVLDQQSVVFYPLYPLIAKALTEGPADERCHHRLSQCRAPLSPNQMCEKLWTLPVDKVSDAAGAKLTDAMQDPRLVALANEAEATNVFGHDAKKNSKGEFVEQGIGSPGRENINHFEAIRKCEGQRVQRSDTKHFLAKQPRPP